MPADGRLVWPAGCLTRSERERLQCGLVIPVSTRRTEPPVSSRSSTDTTRHLRVS